MKKILIEISCEDIYGIDSIIYSDDYRDFVEEKITADYPEYEVEVNNDRQIMKTRVTIITAEEENNLELEEEILRNIDYFDLESLWQDLPSE